MPKVCKHETRKKGLKKDNLTGQFYEWECAECGFKKIEGRSYQHKEICEYMYTIKRMASMKNYDDAYRAIVIVHNMTADVIHRMRKNKRGREAFLKNVF